MKRIVIAGAGFAGISALKPLGKFTVTAPEYETMIFDKNDYTTMMPSLPDIAAKRIKQNLPKASIRDLLPKRVLFKNEEIERIDFDAQSVSAGSKDYEYDYLLLSAGSVSNFYGFNQHLSRIFVLDSFTEALRIEQEFSKYLENRESYTVIIAGAGFTGIETACVLKAYAETNARTINVVLIEKADRVLGNLPAHISDYLESFMSGLGFRVIKRSTVESFNGNDIALETGEIFKDVFFVWTSGSKRAIEDISGTFTTLPDGRINVTEYLQVPGYKNVFAAGDSAAIKSGDGYLRKAAPFSASSGRAAGKNIMRSLENRPLKKFRPVELGWIIPLYPSSIGHVLGLNIKGRPGMSLHYLTCSYRTHGIKHRAGYFLQALKILVSGGQPRP
ncbi:MAG: hypothetical protein A2W01_04655 [Candidatus Solincola sediminis]|uniref:FAD/NAD(P)-binding domain-containing protein n=1 Tax=Candidatus Solincola sediminis TaxID=1797199 RepID=A0A1F2WGU8_9ACTN|nr:MAG: hypothetical protein A2Y75_04725 [Candidatus Solincola sediminis]OFW58275.1 MAG: hypothetical protein A2W01_04655 [Candidatus Solincola sediminis]